VSAPIQKASPDDDSEQDFVRPHTGQGWNLLARCAIL
jgi:hypothetical protein